MALAAPLGIFSTNPNIYLQTKIHSPTLYHHRRPRRRSVHIHSTMSVATETNTNDRRFDLRKYWDEMIREVEGELDRAVVLRYPEKIHESMRYSVMAPNAKRAPPIMCVAACEAVGGSKTDALPTACALEMVHAASLIHDDLPCMDNDLLRRGLPTNHSVFGTEIALLAGDALFPLAFEFLVSTQASTGVASERILKVVSYIARTVGSEGMVAGQYMDLASTGSNKLDPSLVQYIHERKFGIMAECSAVCGGIIGGATAEQLENLQNYGRCVGVLYQIVDDILEEEAVLDDSHKISDKNRTSYPRVYGLEKARETAETLRQMAKTQLANFDKEKATPLYSFVDYAAERKFL